MAVTVRRAEGPFLPWVIAQAKNIQLANWAVSNGLFHGDVDSVPHLVTSDGFVPYTPVPLSIVGMALGDINSAISVMTSAFTFCMQHFQSGPVTNTVNMPGLAHKAQDLTNLATVTAAFPTVAAPTLKPSVYTATGNLVTDTAQVVAAANAIKVAFNLHRVQSGVHYNNDGTNIVNAANATNLATATNLLNNIMSMCNTHVLSGPPASGLITAP